MQHLQACGLQRVQLLLKVPQKAGGFMYQGAVTVPFRDFSFVVRVQCHEYGTTGIREAILFDRQLKAAEKPNLQRPTEPFPGWNPDAPENDQAFPQHPVSRLRPILKRIQDTAVIDEPICQLPKFPLPTRAP